MQKSETQKYEQQIVLKQLGTHRGRALMRLMIVLGLVAVAFHLMFPQYREVIKFSLLVLGAGFGAFQLYEYMRAAADTHDWNRRRAASDVVKDFLSPGMQEHWLRVYDPVIVGRMKYHALNSPDEKASVRALLTYLEYVGVLIKHNVIERDIVFELLAGAWIALHDCTKEYLEEIRIHRKNNKVFELFEQEAKRFVEEKSWLAARAATAGSIQDLRRL